jgi:beta-lactamase regulating signal transducer with metallopeptidase domain
MHEHIARTLYYFEVHLLFASMVWCAAWLLTSIGRGSATTKHWIWVATLLNFILPLGAIVDRLLASHLLWASPLGVIGEFAYNVSQPGLTSAALGFAWLLGATLMFVRLCLRLRSDHLDAQATTRLPVRTAKADFVVDGVQVTFTGSRQTPAVDGVLRPRILLPVGIDRVLSAHELEAVLVHELTHVRRRDNLIRLVQELALCLLWFHPFVWITTSRVALYRELSCDDSVIQCARGADLIAALAKLANPAPEWLLQANASSFLSHRLARLAAEPQTMRRTANTLLTAVFMAVLFGGVLETVAHTACCFVARH